MPVFYVTHTVKANGNTMRRPIIAESAEGAIAQRAQELGICAHDPAFDVQADQVLGDPGFASLLADRERTRRDAERVAQCYPRRI